MAEPTITQVFGTGSQRLANADPAPSSGLFIPDSVLTAAGITTPSTATAEAHFVAILKTGLTYLTPGNFDSNIDQNLRQGTGFKSFINRNGVEYRVDQYVIDMASIDSGITIDPDNY